jgi:CRP/FNR family cyclic AMP-dependent transcriptional regulator
MTANTKDLPSLDTSITNSTMLQDHGAQSALINTPTPRVIKISQVNFRKIPLLAHLTDEELTRVSADMRIRKYTRREIVLQKGGSGDNLLFVLSGQLQVIDVTEDGRAIGLRMLAPGDFFGEIAAERHGTPSVFAFAIGRQFDAAPSGR